VRDDGVEDRIAFRVGEPCDLTRDAKRGKAVDAVGDEDIDHAFQALGIDVSRRRERCRKNREDALEDCHGSAMIAHGRMLHGYRAISRIYWTLGEAAHIVAACPSPPAA